MRGSRRCFGPPSSVSRHRSNTVAEIRDRTHEVQVIAGDWAAKSVRSHARQLGARARSGLAAVLVLVPLAVAAPAARGAGFAPPAFVRFGWASPPLDSTTDAHVAEMAAAGLDVMLPALDDSGG